MNFLRDVKEEVGKYLSRNKEITRGTSVQCFYDDS